MEPRVLEKGDSKVLDSLAGRRSIVMHEMFGRDVAEEIDKIEIFSSFLRARDVTLCNKDTNLFTLEIGSPLRLY